MKEEKRVIVEQLKELLKENECFYIVDLTGMSVNNNNTFRDACFADGVVFKVAKNSFIKKALQAAGIEETKIDEISVHLKSISGLLFVRETYCAPAKIIDNFKKNVDKKQLQLKCAYVDGALYSGEDKLKELKTLRTRKEVIGSVVASLNCGIHKIISSIFGINNKISGIVKSLEERG